MGGIHSFLSRPRRSGKGLFLDTLMELVEGLKVYDRWDWSVRRPEVRLSTGRRAFAEPGYVPTNVMAQLDGTDRRLGVESRYDRVSDRFVDLIETLHRRTGRRVAVLVAEYAEPTLDEL